MIKNQIKPSECVNPNNRCPESRRPGIAFRIIPVLIAVALWNCCGYKFAGDESLPGSIRRVCIPMPTNRSAETGLEIAVVNALIREFTRNGKEVTSRDNAEIILHGHIESIASETVTRKGVHAASERRVSFVIRFDLTDAYGNVIVSGYPLSASEAYAVSDDKIASEDAKKNALKTAAERLAETVYLRLSEIEF